MLIRNYTTLVDETDMMPAADYSAIFIIIQLSSGNICI